VRKSIIVLCLMLAVPFSLSAELSPEARLDSAVIAFRAKDYASAEPDLAAAALELQSRLAPGSPAARTYERALVYLALTQFRLGREDDARQSILRLAAAEKVDPVYTAVMLDGDGEDFDALVAALAPDAGLPKRSEPVFDATPADGRLSDGVPADRNRTGGAVTDAAPLPPVTPTTVLPEPAPIRSRVVPSAATSAHLSHFAALRQAEALADEGQSMAAVRLWESLVDAPDAQREVLIAAAIGLYRIGAYRQALAAFDRLGTLGRGEEDLRYYHAVVLYEVGRFDEARRELACALPFIQATEDVERYRLKINQPRT
jgi:tetratricopeptide (TPR) repeat protein